VAHNAQWAYNNINGSLSYHSRQNIKVAKISRLYWAPFVTNGYGGARQLRVSWGKGFRFNKKGTERVCLLKGFGFVAPKHQYPSNLISPKFPELFYDVLIFKNYLKGIRHKIIDLKFFHQTTSPGPLIHRLMSRFAILVRRNYILLINTSLYMRALSWLLIGLCWCNCVW
jgi:hypothetical protein